MENKVEQKTYKHICEQCKFKCNTKARWENHIKTELHKTGERKKRKDCKEPIKCERCEYKTKNNMLMKQHILNVHGTKEQREKEFKYYCKICDVGTYSIDLHNRHENTNKHKKFIIRNSI
jgi:hypothetical protein